MTARKGFVLKSNNVLIKILTSLVTCDDSARSRRLALRAIHFHTLIILILATGFNSETSKMRLRSNAKAMKQEVLTKIPIGSSIKAAKNIMVNNGFKCEFSWNDSFVDQDENGNKIVRTGMDFLYCNKEKFCFSFN